MVDEKKADIVLRYHHIFNLRDYFLFSQKQKLNIYREFFSRNGYNDRLIDTIFAVSERIFSEQNTDILFTSELDEICAGCNKKLPKCEYPDMLKDEKWEQIFAVLKKEGNPFGWLGGCNSQFLAARIIEWPQPVSLEAFADGGKSGYSSFAMSVVHALKYLSAGITETIEGGRAERSVREKWW